MKKLYTIIMASMSLMMLFPGFACSQDAAQVAQALDQYEQRQDKTLPPARRRHEFSVGVERYNYSYKETVSGRHFMDNKGHYNGFLAAYTFRPADMDSMLREIVNVFRAELRYAAGRVDYTGNVTFSGIKDYMYELRGLAGQEYVLSPSLTVMPYAGLGLRYLNDGLEAIQPGGYNRESRCVYLPIGATGRWQWSAPWGLAANLEYDHLLQGRQISHFEDIQDGGGANAGYAQASNTQRSGFGVRGELSLVRVWPRAQVSFGPFYRYWHIQDSDIAPWVQNGTPIGIVMEPDNVTKEIGLKMAVIF